MLVDVPPDAIDHPPLDALDTMEPNVSDWGIPPRLTGERLVVLGAEAG